MEYSLSSINEVVKYLREECKDYNVWIFDAEMGAGKTTLIKALCEGWQVEDHVSSPTFSIVNEYYSTQVGTIYHFDFYRIDNELEAENIGVEEYFYSPNYCLIEWASKIPSFIPEKYIVVKINIEDTSMRTLKIQRYGK